MQQKITSANRHLTSLILLLSGIAFNPTASAADPLATRYYEDAVSRFNSGDAKGAMIQLKNALQRDPAQLSAKILLGRSYLALSEPRIAEEELVQALQLGADPLLVALDLARARNELGKYDENIQDLVPIRFPPAQQPDLWVELGIARLGKDDPDGARIAFEEALKILPGHPGGRIGLARIPLKKKDYREAEKLADQVLATAPENAEAWFIRGSAAHAQGKFKDAIKAYGKAYELDPKNLQAALGEATAMLEAGKPATAAAMLKPLREKYPAVATIPYLQSEALNAIGRPEEAKTARDAASGMISKYSPSDITHNPNQMLLFGTIAFETGQLETAYKFFSAYVETSGDDILGRKMLGKTLLGLGKPGEAQKVLGRISASYQADAEALGLLGDAYVQLGDYDAADRYYRQAIRDHNGGPAIMRRLGVAQYERGQTEQALNTLQALMDRLQGGRRKDDTALLLALLYYTEGRHNEAGRLAERLVENDSKNFNARNLLGLVEITRGRSAEGRRILEDILQEKPDFRPARWNLIKLDIAQGNTSAAGNALRDMLAEDPNDVRTLLESARFATAVGDRRVAIMHLEKIRELEPANVLANIELIETYLANGEAGLAMARALALDKAVPQDFLAKEALARVQVVNAEPADAKATLGQMARLAGNDPKRLLQTAKLQSSINAIDDAVWSLTKALALESGNIEARTELAAALFRSRKSAEAEAELNRVLEADPRNPVALAMLADIRLSQRRADEAIALYRRSQAVVNTPRITVSLHRALMTAGQPEQALAVLEAWHAEQPRSPLVMGVLADHWEFAGRDEQALNLRRELVELDPENAAAWSGLARALADVDSEQAVKAAIEAHKLSPDNARVLDTLGWAFTQLGELDKGLAYLREALSRDADNPAIHYHLGVALQEYGNGRAALRALKRAVELSPSFPERDDAIARLSALTAQ